MNVEKLKRLQAQVRIGGKGTPRRKKKLTHQTAATDDKKLQSSLKKLSVSTIPGIEEVNIIKDDLTIIHFNNPKAQASLSANTFAVTGHGETKKVVEMLPEILPQLGQETVSQLRIFANSMTTNATTTSGQNQKQQGKQQNIADDDVPLLVEDFDQIAKQEASSEAKVIANANANTNAKAKNKSKGSSVDDKLKQEKESKLDEKQQKKETKVEEIESVQSEKKEASLDPIKTQIIEQKPLQSTLNAPLNANQVDESHKIIENKPKDTNEDLKKDATNQPSNLNAKSQNKVKKDAQKATEGNNKKDLQKKEPKKDKDKLNANVSPTVNQKEQKPNKKNQQVTPHKNTEGTEPADLKNQTTQKQLVTKEQIQPKDAIEHITSQGVALNQVSKDEVVAKAAIVDAAAPPLGLAPAPRQEQNIEKEAMTPNITIPHQNETSSVQQQKTAETNINIKDLALPIPSVIPAPQATTSIVLTTECEKKMDVMPLSDVLKQEIIPAENSSNTVATTIAAIAVEKIQSDNIKPEKGESPKGQAPTPAISNENAKTNLVTEKTKGKPVSSTSQASQPKVTAFKQQSRQNAPKETASSQKQVGTKEPIKQSPPIQQQKQAVDSKKVTDNKKPAPVKQQQSAQKTSPSLSSVATQNPNKTTNDKPTATGPKPTNTSAKAAPNTATTATSTAKKPAATTSILNASPNSKPTNTSPSPSKSKPQTTQAAQKQTKQRPNSTANVPNASNPKIPEKQAATPIGSADAKTAGSATPQPTPKQ